MSGGIGEGRSSAGILVEKLDQRADACEAMRDLYSAGLMRDAARMIRAMMSALDHPGIAGK